MVSDRSQQKAAGKVWDAIKEICGPTAAYSGFVYVTRHRVHVGYSPEGSERWAEVKVPRTGLDGRMVVLKLLALL